MSHSKDKLFQLLLREAEQPFSGWNFAHITRTGRWHTTPLPWSYGSTILPYIRQARALLDMGTGGGEFLSLLSPFPPHTCATESYPPNIPLAQQRLEPLGIKVIEFTEDTTLPFQNEEFDLIINRHESYAPSEVHRLLKPQGCFITQQVGDQNDLEINQIFGNKPDLEEHPWTAEYASKMLKSTGFRIIKMNEAFPYTRFYDVGALVYYLKAIPWVITGFSVKQHHKTLFHLHTRMQQKGFLDIQEHRFIIISQKP